MQMRTSIAALALIRRERDGQSLYLAQWHPRWQRFHLVGGHKGMEESFQECVIREVTEELEILEGTDFDLGPTALCHLEYTAWSESAQEVTSYTMELFEVKLTDAARQKVDGDPKNRWLTNAEVRNQRCKDGKPVSEAMVRLLTTIGVIGRIDAL